MLVYLFKFWISKISEIYKKEFIPSALFFFFAFFWRWRTISAVHIVTPENENHLISVDHWPEKDETIRASRLKFGKSRQAPMWKGRNGLPALSASHAVQERDRPMRLSSAFLFISLIRSAINRFKYGKTDQANSPRSSTWYGSLSTDHTDSVVWRTVALEACRSRRQGLTM